MKEYLFTSESVAVGHPDKIADQISDLTLDYFLARDKEARVAAETMVTPQKIILAGEIRANFTLDEQDLEQRIRNLIKEIGYVQGEFFTYDKVAIEMRLTAQSPDIAIGVDEKGDKPEGAGDQGLMFGYACSETENLMPAPIYYSHLILRKISESVRAGELSGFGADAKSQVTFKYIDDQPVKIDTILVSIQHDESLTLSEIRKKLQPFVTSILPQKLLNSDTKFLFNPTGKFVVGGPESDVGLTGRKIIVDTYGGAAPHGGGAFSGKDPTKVDRSAAYMARYLAKNVVASGIAKKCLIQIAYGIGIAEPISFYLNSFGTSKIPDQKIAEFLVKNIGMTPKAIRTKLQLNNPIYLKTASYGHFGRDSVDGYFTWEATDIASEIAKELGIDR